MFDLNQALFVDTSPILALRLPLLSVDAERAQELDAVLCRPKLLAALPAPVLGAI